MSFICVMYAVVAYMAHARELGMLSANGPGIWPENRPSFRCVKTILSVF